MVEKTTKSAAEAEVLRNYEAFVRELPRLLTSHRGKFVLMQDAKVVEIFDTAGDAHRAGKKLFPEIPFSVQEITDTSIDLGFFSHAVP